MILKWLKYLLVMLVVSSFFFPFSLFAFPQNSKNVMAALGLVFMFMTLVYSKNFTIPKGILILLLLASFVSLASLFSINYNQTPDNSYVTYLRAAFIWLSAAYVASMVIYLAHGRVDVRLIVNYLIAVCLFQCTMALLIDFIPAVKTFVDSYFDQGQDMLNDMNRLYGIGAALDVAGSRFAAVLIAIAAYVDHRKDDLKAYEILFYLISFILISVVGNMIARTTIVGLGIGLGYLVLRQFQGIFQQRNQGGDKKVLGMWGVALGVLIPIAVFYYNTSEQFHELMRFGFEGFFSLAETGEWMVASNETLESMIVFPADLETWIVGDGYFANQRNDINYLGDATEGGFYMGTDIGYLRFIFYFGLIGLFAMSMVIIYAASLCAESYPEYRTIFWLVCLANFVVWLKVSTDLFLFFCPFICASIIANAFEQEEEDEDEDEEEAPDIQEA